MEGWIVLLISFFPALIVGGVTVYLVQNFWKKDLASVQFKMKESARSTLLPVKLQAYERLVILLERVRLNNLVMRVTKPGMNAQYLQKEMLKQIRSEFEHNLSQQLYVSDAAWKKVLIARDQTIAIMKLAGEKLEADEGAAKYTNKVLAFATAEEYNAIDIAISYLRGEMGRHF